MNSTMITATNTLSQLQKQMDIISNNLANLDTTGYKSKQATFTDLLFNQINNQPNANNEIGRLTPMGIRQGVGAKLGQIQINMEQGIIKPTGRELDTALQKEGQYYKVLVQKDNTSTMQYTRNGALYLTPVAQNEVMLITSDGYPVLDENNQQITFSGDASKFTIDPNGRLDVTMTNGTRSSFNLGVIQVNKPQFLEQKGGNLVGLPDNVPGVDVFTDLTGQERQQISIGQRMLEQSNVDMSKEMTNLINVQRAYQFQARSVTMADQMMGLINGIR
ncbi:MAG TPA: flagellar hook-basal body protein [Bacillales bacterium]|nr:flagellar hook-basal body protein [Bacillales bacterium]